jgi:hypothetical protein
MQSLNKNTEANRRSRFSTPTRVRVFRPLNLMEINAFITNSCA